MSVKNLWDLVEAEERCNDICSRNHKSMNSIPIYWASFQKKILYFDTFRYKDTFHKMRLILNLWFLLITSLHLSLSLFSNKQIAFSSLLGIVI